MSNKFLKKIGFDNDINNLLAIGILILVVGLIAYTVLIYEISKIHISIDNLESKLNSHQYKLERIHGAYNKDEFILRGVANLNSRVLMLEQIFENIPKTTATPSVYRKADIYLIPNSDQLRGVSQ